jgi:hypothetical protein
LGGISKGTSNSSASSSDKISPIDYVADKRRLLAFGISKSSSLTSDANSQIEYVADKQRRLNPKPLEVTREVTNAIATKVETVEEFLEAEDVNRSAKEIFPDLDYDSNLEDSWEISTPSEILEEAADPRECSFAAQKNKAALEDIACEARQRKATKSDDAEIPTYLWEDHLMQDDPTPWNALTTDMPTLRRGMNLMRRRMLAWWKQRVTRSFLEWIAIRHRSMVKIDSWADTVSGAPTVLPPTTHPGVKQVVNHSTSGHITAKKSTAHGGDAVFRPLEKTSQPVVLPLEEQQTLLGGIGMTGRGRFIGAGQTGTVTQYAMD